MIMPDEVDKRFENRKNQEQKITVVKQRIRNIKQKIEERRNKAYVASLQGYTNQEIANNLGVSLSTIEKDMYFMKYHCLKWAHDIFSTNKHKPLVDSYNQIELVQIELWNLYRNEKDPELKRKILDSITSNSIKKDKILYEKKFTPRDEERLEILEKEVENDITSELLQGKPDM